MIPLWKSPIKLPVELPLELPIFRGATRGPPLCSGHLLYTSDPIRPRIAERHNESMHIPSSRRYTKLGQKQHILGIEER